MRTCGPGLIVLLVAQCAVAWSIPQAPLRRELVLKIDEKRIDESNTAQAEFIAPGIARDASDLRLMTDAGDAVPFRLLSVGRTDEIAIIFNPVRGVGKYHAYWGSDRAPPAPRGEVKLTSGLLVETKRLGSGQMDNTRQLDQLYERSGDVLGRAMIDRLFVGYVPTRVPGPTISRITGVLYVGADGQHQLALSADDRGGLRLDGKDLLFAPGFPEDIRFNRTVQLARGPHAVEYFHVDLGADWRVTLGWRGPGGGPVNPVDANAFGKVIDARAGALEQNKKLITADLRLIWQGEAIVAERSSYRIKLEAVVPTGARNYRATWHFSDGQTASGESVEHVFLTPGVYEIGLKVKAIQGDDERTFRVEIGRDPYRIIEPEVEQPSRQADIVGKYDFAKLNSDQQTMATRLLARAGAIDPMLKALSALCEWRRHDDQQRAVDAIAEAVDAASDARRASDLAGALAKLPDNSNLHPKAADLHARVLLWRVGDFKAAATMLEPFARRESRMLKSVRMQALLLDGRVEEARKALDDLPHEQELGQRVALSGALARSIEYFIDQNELDAAADKWDDWQRQFPDSFWEGYSALLKVRMLEPKNPEIAAKVAEAFALAVPGSPYAPQLLDRASRLHAKTDPKKSEQLRKLLKEKYPEDPLAQ